MIEGLKSCLKACASVTSGRSFYILEEKVLHLVRLDFRVLVNIYGLGMTRYTY